MSIVQSSGCRDFMDPTMDSTKHILNYLMPILEQVDRELHDFMTRYFSSRLQYRLSSFNSLLWPLEVTKVLLCRTPIFSAEYKGQHSNFPNEKRLFSFDLIRAEVGTIFALSWLITWFGHVLSDFKHTLRLYDFFLSSHPLMPIYLAATVKSRLQKPSYTGSMLKSPSAVAPTRC